MLKSLFLIISFLLALFIIIYKVFLCRLKRTSKISVFVSVMAGLLLIYVLSAITFSFFVKNFYLKILFLFLGTSPFIIGKFVTYKSEKYYIWLQMATVLSGFILALTVEL